MANAQQRMFSSEAKKFIEKPDDAVCRVGKTSACLWQKPELLRHSTLRKMNTFEENHISPSLEVRMIDVCGSGG